jgi:hypothetical protein
MTQKYKCIAQPTKGMMFTIGKEYEVESYKSYYTLLDNNGVRCSFYHEEFYRLFTAVEPTTTQPMKYKVTITSTDLTGHEDEKEVYENVNKANIVSFLDDKLIKSISIEPMPEKQKVTVWFYLVELSTNSFISLSSVTKEMIIDGRNSDIEKGRKVSEIKSMEVEI